VAPLADKLEALVAEKFEKKEPVLDETVNLVP